MSHGKVLSINLINVHKKKKTIIAGIKLTIICFGNFRLNPKSYEIYNSNPTFPVEFSSRQGFFNIQFLLSWAKRVFSSEVCGSLRRLRVVGTSNFD